MGPPRGVATVARFGLSGLKISCSRDIVSKHKSWPRPRLRAVVVGRGHVRLEHFKKNARGELCAIRDAAPTGSS